MKAAFHDLAEKGRLRTGPFATYPKDRYGHFAVRHPGGAYLFVIAVEGDAAGQPVERFDHASVSVRGADAGPPERCPTWEEMCWVKDLFWDAEECVVQYHPPRSSYVNRHPYVLHLWRPSFADIPMPPLECV